MRYGLIGPGRHGSRYLMPENGGNEITTVLRRQEGSLIIGKTVTTDLDEFIDDVDAVIIATPPDSHRDLALACLTARLPLLIEKPLALDWESCEAILSMGEDVGVPVMVGHTHLFHPAFEAIVHASLEGVEQPETRITSYSGGNGPIRPYSALLDWGPHDVAMAIAVAKEAPTGSVVRELSPGTFEIEIEFPCSSASIVVSNRFATKRRLFTMEERYANKVTQHLYTGDEPTAATPMARMVEVFKAAVEDGLEDYRATRVFLSAIYDVLTPVAEPQAKRG